MVGTVIGDHNAIENTGMRTAGTDLGECMVQRFQGFLHALLRVLLDLVDHSFDSSIRVPSAPPSTMLSRAPGLFMLKTRSGMLWRSEERRVGKECVSTCSSR